MPLSWARSTPSLCRPLNRQDTARRRSVPTAPRAGARETHARHTGRIQVPARRRKALGAPRPGQRAQTGRKAGPRPQRHAHLRVDVVQGVDAGVLQGGDTHQPCALRPAPCSTPEPTGPARSPRGPHHRPELGAVHRALPPAAPLSDGLKRRWPLAAESRT